MTHSVSVGRVAEKLLALRGAVALLLGDREELGNLSLGDAEGVVADEEALLVDAVAELALVSCALHKLRADGREEVGTQGQRQPLRQVGVAEDAVHLDGVVVPVALVLLGVPLGEVSRLCAEHALPPHVLNVETAVALGKAAVAILVGQAARVVRERLVVEHGLPGEEFYVEEGVLRVAELLEDRVLALCQHCLELELQKVGVGLHLRALLFALILLEELHELTHARVGESGKERIILKALKESRLRGRESEGEERVHGCHLERERKCV